MENKQSNFSSEAPQSSFIPKQAISRQLGREHQPVGLFMLVSIIVLGLSLLFTGGVYAYKYLLDQEINRPCPEGVGDDIDQCGLEARLSWYRDRVERDRPLIDAVQKLDRQLNRAQAILAEHQTILPLFALLEEETLETVRYSSFDYGADGRVSFSGQARSYESIAVQSIEFAKNPFIKDFVFSGLNLDQDGTVVFKLEMEIDPILTSYIASLN